MMNRSRTTTRCQNLTPLAAKLILPSLLINWFVLGQMVVRAEDNLADEIKSKLGKLFQPPTSKPRTPPKTEVEQPPQVTNAGLDLFHRTEKESGRTAAEEEFLRDFRSLVDEMWQEDSASVRSENLHWLQTFQADKAEWQRLQPLIQQGFTTAREAEPSRELIRQAVWDELQNKPKEASTSYEKAVAAAPNDEAILVASIRWLAKSACWCLLRPQHTPRNCSNLLGPSSKSRARKRSPIRRNFHSTTPMPRWARA